MSLPIIPLATDTVTLSDGSVVTVRALSRTAAAQVMGLMKEGVRNWAACEAIIVSKSLGIPLEEAEEWLDSTTVEDPGLVIDRAVAMSGLSTVKDGADPQ